MSSDSNHLSINYYSDPLIPFAFTVERGEGLYVVVRVTNEHLLITRELRCCRTHTYRIESTIKGSRIICDKCGKVYETIIGDLLVKELFDNTFFKLNESNDLTKFISDTLCSDTDNIFAFYTVEEYVIKSFPDVVSEILVFYNMRKSSVFSDSSLKNFWLRKHLELSQKLQNLSAEVSF